MDVYQPARAVRLARRLCSHAVFAVALCGLWLAVAVPGAHGQALRTAVSPSLPAGSQVTLSPTFPKDNNGLQSALVSVGQGASYTVKIPISGGCGNPCWVDQGYNVDLYVIEAGHVQNDTDSAKCGQLSGDIKIDTVKNGSAGEIFVSGGFTWPATATSTAFGSPYYVLCIHFEVQPGVTFPSQPRDFTTGTVSDKGSNYVYKVIWDHAPAVSVSPSPVQQGQSVTISGQNWVPVYADYPATLVSTSINQYPTANKIVYYAHSQVSVDANGTFSITFPITTGYPPGRYFACVGSQLVLTYCQGVGSGVPFTIVVAQPQGGGGASTTPTVSGTATAGAGGAGTPTTGSIGATPSLGAGTGGSSGGQSGFPWLLIIGIAAAGALLIAGVIAVAFIAGRRQQPALPEGQPWTPDRVPTMTPPARGWPQPDEPTWPTRGNDDPWR